MKTDAVNLGNFSLSSLYQFIKRLLVLIERIGADKLKITELVDNVLRPAFEKLGQVYQRDKRSKFTKTVAEIDKEMDETTVAMTGTIRVAKKSDDPEEAKSAENLEFVFNDFKGLIREKRADQSAKTTKLVKLLKSDYLPDVEKIGLGKLLAKLERLNDEMIAMEDKRVDEKAKKFKLDAPTVKKEVISAYRMLCGQVEISAAAQGSANFEEFIRNLNVIIGEFGGTGVNASQPTDTNDTPDTEPVEVPETPTEPVVEETHEERMANARAWTTVAEGEWKNGDYCWHMVNSVKTYWKLLDATQKDVKPYLSGGEVAWELVS
jgi:phage tail tube protein FII